MCFRGKVFIVKFLSAPEKMMQFINRGLNLFSAVTLNFFSFHYSVAVFIFLSSYSIPAFFQAKFIDAFFHFQPENPLLPRKSTGGTFDKYLTSLIKINIIAALLLCVV